VSFLFPFFLSFFIFIFIFYFSGQRRLATSGKSEPHDNAGWQQSAMWTKHHAVSASTARSASREIRAESNLDTAQEAIQEFEQGS